MLAVYRERMPMPPQPDDAGRRSPSRGPRPAPAGLLRRRSVRVLAVLGALFLLLLIATPYAIQYGIKHWLTLRGAQRVVVQDVDFNPFSGVLEIDGLQTWADGHRALSVQRAAARLSWWPLWKKRVHLEDLDLSGVDLSIRPTPAGTWRVGGLLLAATGGAAGGGNTWGVGVDRFHLHQARIDYAGAGGDTSLHIKEADVTALISWKSADTAHLGLQGTFNGAPVTLDANLHAFAPEPRLAGRLRLQGLSLASFSRRLEPRVHGLDGKLTTDGKIVLRRLAHGAVQITHQGTMTLADAHMLAAGVDMHDQRLKWDGKIALERSRDVPGIRVSVDGMLDNTGLNLEDRNRKLDTTVGSLAWTGRLDYGMRDVPTGYEAHGGLKAGDLAVDDAARGLKILQLQQLQVEKLSARGTYDVDIGGVRLQNLSLAQAARNDKTAADHGPPLLHAGAVVMKKLHVKNLNDLSVANVELHDAVGVLHRDQHGNWYLFDQLSAGDAAQGGGTPNHANSLALRVARATIVGDSRIQFRDATVTPVYEDTLAVTDASIEHIDNTRPTEPSPVRLSGKMGKYTTVTVKGQVEPFAAHLNLNLTGSVKNLDLPPLSPYTARALGYNLQSGQASADIRLRIAGGKLSGTNLLKLNNLAITPVNQDKMQQMTSQLSMPLDTALSMLRDDDNNIRLKVPVSGNINDPKFSLGDAINQALGNTMKLAAMSYIKVALQPYGAAITLIQLAEKAASTVQLQPVLFQPGSASLSNSSRDYLLKLGQLMRKRPDLQIKICPLAVNRDRTALQKAASGGKEGQQTPAAKQPAAVPDQRLRDLATQRAANIKAWLVQNAGADPGRLFVCRPQINTTPNAEARVNLEL
jgi:hypothetical protein